MPKTPTKESYKVVPIPDTQLVKLDLTITRGKYIALIVALEKYAPGSPVATDLLAALNRELPT